MLSSAYGVINLIHATYFIHPIGVPLQQASVLILYE